MLRREPMNPRTLDWLGATAATAAAALCWYMAYDFSASPEKTQFRLLNSTDGHVRTFGCSTWIRAGHTNHPDIGTKISTVRVAHRRWSEHQCLHVSGAPYSGIAFLAHGLDCRGLRRGGGRVAVGVPGT